MDKMAKGKGATTAVGEKECEPTMKAKFLKLLLILICYSALFVTLVKLTIWLLYGWTSLRGQVALLDWIECLPGPDCRPYPSNVLKCLGRDILLFIMFMAQHSLLTERNLAGTYIHRKVFIEWKINGALYTLTTAIALYLLMINWHDVPVFIWNRPNLEPYCFFLHLLAWISLYGTSLMQDMPELIGLHQVVFINDSTSRKSAEFRSMLKQQRHLGFIPFTILLTATPVMTLDRFLFLIVVLTYSYVMWRDPASFEYISSMTNSKRTRLSGTRDG